MYKNQSKIQINVYFRLFLIDLMSGMNTNAPEMTSVSIRGPSIRSLPTSIK